jgi:hypothetical protein
MSGEFKVGQSDKNPSFTCGRIKVQINHGEEEVFPYIRTKTNGTSREQVIKFHAGTFIEEK